MARMASSRAVAIAAAAILSSAVATTAGEAEIKSAQGAIDAQLQAFKAQDGAKAYSYAAPSIKHIFPTVDSVMQMVTRGYQPVYRAQTYSFGKAEEKEPGHITQQVLIVGPEGKDYEAVYTIQIQPDGSALITGCSLRAANTLST